MTFREKLIVKKMKEKEIFANQISSVTKVRLNTVKSYCKREEIEICEPYCRECNAPIPEGRKFCSVECRKSGGQNIVKI